MIEILACPDTPNCVSSQADPSDGTHYIEPLPIPAEPVMERLQEILRSLPRLEIESVTDEAIAATQRSLIFRFVDDITLVRDSEAGVIHVRSASRVGKGDMGVNRRRVEQIRSLIEQQEG